MRTPLRFCHGNLLWDGAGRVWALYRLATRSYADQPRADKLALFGELAGLFAGLARDLQLLRVSRPFTPEAYAAQALATVDPRHADAAVFEAHLAAHRRLLAAHRAARPEVYLAARLAGPERRTLGARALDLFGAREPRGIGGRALARLRAEEEGVAEALADFAEAERAGSEDVAWLVLRAFARGVTAPLRPADWRPQALVFEDPTDEFRLEPLEHDVLRLFDCPIRVGARALTMEGEGAESHQALLAVGALPEELPFPDPRAELLFAPLESLEFPVDACLWLRHVDNREAAALVRRRIVDADNVYAEESIGDHGPSVQSDRRPEAARELDAYLGDPSRPPLLRASLSLALGAPDPAELERRVEALRRAYGGVELHRPAGAQLDLWIGHLPGQAAPIRDYEDHLLVEQVAAMVPTATHQVGTEAGPYIGHTLSGSAQPVLFDLAAASQGARPPSVLLLGAPGAGKTVLLELLIHQARLAGSRVVDIDPKGDHRLEDLPGLGADLEVIELGDDPAHAGRLDPLRNAPPGTAADAAVAWLTDVLPAPVPPGWRTEIRRAVAETIEAGGTGCRAVIDRLLAAEDDARAAGRALAVHSEGGLAALGFAGAGEETPRGARAGVTQLRIRNLPRPAPGTPRGELSEDERVGQALLRLLAGHAMALLGEDRSRHKVIAIDEAFFLLADPAGRRLVAQLNRWGRSEFATPLLVTHLVADAAEMDNLMGARFVFGMESEAEAAGALALLHLDPEDSALRRRLLAYRRGRCLLRDWEGRVGAMQVEIPDPALLAALDTTPRRDDRAA